MARSREIRAGKAYVEIGVRDKLRAGLDKVAARFRSIGQIVTKAGIGMTAIGAATLTPLAAASKLFASMGDEINKASGRTGIAVEELSRLKYAAEQSGATLGDLETGIKKMSRVLVEAAAGSESAKDALSQLGISVEQLQGLSPDEQFKKLANALSQVEDATLRSALAQEIFGKAGTTLLPLILEGADGIAALTKRSDELRVTVTKAEAALATKFGDALDDVLKQIKAITAAIGGAVAGALLPFGKAINGALAATIDFAKENRALVVAVTAAAVGITAVGLGLTALGPAFLGLAGAASLAATAVSAIGPVLAAITSPLGLIVAGTVAAGAALLYFTDLGGKSVNFLAGKFSELTAVAKDTFGGIADALASGDIVLGANILWAGLKVAWTKGTAELQKIWIGFKAQFSGVLLAMYFGAQETFTKLAATIKTAFASVVGALQSLRQQAIDALSKELGDSYSQAAANDAKATIRKAVEAGKITQEEGARLIADVDKQRDSVLAADEKKREQDRQAREAELAAKLQAIKDEERAALQKISDDEIAAAGLNDQQKNAELQKLEEEKKRLQDELAALRGTAKEKRGLSGSLTSGSFTPPTFDPNDTPASKSVAAQGFFSAAAIKAFAGGNENTQREIAEATKATARGVKQLVDYGGARFA